MNELQLWMTENAMSVKLQLLELKRQRDISCIESDSVMGTLYIFKKGGTDSALSNYVDGKSFKNDWIPLETRGVILNVKSPLKEEAISTGKRWLPKGK